VGACEFRMLTCFLIFFVYIIFFNFKAASPYYIRRCGLLLQTE